MDLIVLIKAAILGIVEGLTEFLPISSTGHLIVASSLLEFRGDTVATFEIAIQTGAMFAVIWEYRQRLTATIAGISERAARSDSHSTSPSRSRRRSCFGLLLGKVIKEYLFHPVPVAAAFVVGGVVILWAEARHKRLYGERDLLGQRHARVETVDDMTPLDALKVGLVQCLALIPGTSRSGATIIGA